MNIDIHENVVSGDMILTYQKQFFNDNLSWYWNDNTSNAAKREHLDERGAFTDMNIIDLGQFSHLFRHDYKNNSQFEVMIQPIYDFVRNHYKVGKVVRSKANFLHALPTYPRDAINTPHVDSLGAGSLSALFYVNNVDGDTVFYNEKYEDEPLTLTEYTRVTPSQNKLVVFDSEYYHASMNPEYSPRVVINIIFEKE